MGYIYFILGGARSGKSTYAEELAKSLSNKVAYIATAEIIDEEMQKRVNQHRLRRLQSWKTFEINEGKPNIKNFEEILNAIVSDKFEIVLIDCITILLFRLIYKYEIDKMQIINNELENEVENEVKIFFEKFIKLIKTKNLKFIIVSNEVGMGIVPSYPLGRIFRDLMGEINKKISEASDEVYFLIAGLAQKLK
jgi:adenosylcobinamide kinase/adenosylcobinamide-phosphate guanylyltransferase